MRTLYKLVRRIDIWMMEFYVVKWRGNATIKMQPAWEWLNLKVMSIADRLQKYGH